MCAFVTDHKASDPAGWFHAHVEVGRDTVTVFVDGAGGLWVDSQEGSVANLQIRPAT